MASYSTPEILVISMTGEHPILNTSLTIDNWTTDDDSIDFLP